MIGYQLKLTLRRIIKDKVFSIINIAGLMIGITSFLILFLHVNNEKSFDKHFTDHQDIYRVISTPVGHDANIWARSLGIVYESVAGIPEVVEATQFSHTPVGTLKINDQIVQQKDIMSVDSSFISMFSVQSLVGDLSEINKPNTVFISEDFAKKYFKNENPIGKTLEVDALQYTQNLGTYEIRGIVKNTHPKTHFQYELLLSQKGALQERFTSLPDRKIQWVYSYIKLQKGAKPSEVASKILAFYNDSELKETRGPKDYQFSLMPLDDIHLKSDYRFELKESSSKINIGLFIMISVVILLISLLNFINLTIAKLIKRARELGLKKSIGAAKIQLIGQVLVDVLIMCSFSILLAFGLVESLKPLINQLFEINFDIYYSEPVVYLSMLGIVLTCLILTALFATFFLFGKTSTIDILAERNNFSGSLILKSLLVGQVCIVIILMSGTFLVNKQINFISNRSLGFDKENVVVLQVKDFSKDPEVFADALRKQSQVKAVGFTSQHFGYPSQSLPLDGLGIDGSAEFVFANYDYLKTMNIQLVESWINPSADTVQGMIINEHLYKKLMERHGSMEALNAYQQTQPLAPDQVRIKFIGVAKDFNYHSAHQVIGDFAFWLDESRNRARFTHVRLNPGNLRSAMTQIETIWKDYYPAQDFNYFFIDDKIAQQYKGEIILSRILSSFSILGILISIIGISALSLFISQQRTKEIGIRKVNGAKVSEVLTMLNKDFIKWVVIAFVIAAPLAYYTMSKWLENFAYKTNLSWWVFALAGLLALGIALLTVSWQSWKAATRNPVEALRYE
ncbi:ABC transporter permease [Sunxiuqinia sp. A32]|uniref:ABC transporter permease n=1 Tax=Sunxiuqinia sp. A32 TaxID=3461496 RepID=UPI0040467EE1